LWGGIKGGKVERRGWRWGRVLCYGLGEVRGGLGVGG